MYRSISHRIWSKQMIFRLGVRAGMCTKRQESRFLTRHCSHVVAKRRIGASQLSMPKIHSQRIFELPCFKPEETVTLYQRF